MKNTPYIYFATVCIEPNRWSAHREPALTASTWVERALSDGFDGIELWENHYLRADAAERDRLRTALGESRAPCILSTYWDFDEEQTPDRGVANPHQIRDALADLPVGGMKFNIGKDPRRLDNYRDRAQIWLPVFRSQMTGDRRLICECHGGTVIETPQAAQAFRNTAGGLDIEYVVHPLSLTEPQLTGWLDTGRVGHVHIQTRHTSLGELPAASWPRELLSRVPQATFTVEFTRGVGSDGETAEMTYQAAREDLTALRLLLRQ